MKGSVGGGSSRHPAVEQPDKEQHLMETARARWPLKLSPLDSWTKVHVICPYVNILF